MSTYLWAMLSLAPSSSPQFLPTDILTHHIFFLLPLSSLMAASMVCTNWRKASRPCFPKRRTTSDVYISLLKDFPTPEFIEWFEKYLLFRIEKMTKYDIYRSALNAARGNDRNQDSHYFFSINFFRPLY
jgi:hypothetical protein